MNPVTRSITYKYKDKMRTLNIPVMPFYERIKEEQKFNLPNVLLEFREKIQIHLNKLRKRFAKRMSELGKAPAFKHVTYTGTSLPTNLPNCRTPQTLRVIVKVQKEEMKKNPTQSEKVQVPIQHLS